MTSFNLKRSAISEGKRALGEAKDIAMDTITRGLYSKARFVGRTQKVLKNSYSAYKHAREAERIHRLLDRDREKREREGH